YDTAKPARRMAVFTYICQQSRGRRPVVRKYSSTRRRSSSWKALPFANFRLTPDRRPAPPVSVFIYLIYNLYYDICLMSIDREERVLKALNPTPFGIRDPLFDQDVAFYVFRLPLWSSLYGWLMGVLVCLGSRRHRRVFLHPGHSGLPGGVLMSRRARGHLLVLAALLLLLKAAGYRLAMFDLLFSERGVAFGAGWLAARSERPRTS